MLFDGVLSWLLLFVVVAGNKEKMSNVSHMQSNASHAQPSSQRHVVTGAEFVEKLKQLMQNFRNGLPVTNLASYYRVIYCNLLMFLVMMSSSYVYL